MKPEEFRIETCGLRVNQFKCALGVSPEAAVFSWSYSGAPEDCELRQTGYRIVIAKGARQFVTGEYVIDTGWVKGQANLGVELPEELAAKLEKDRIYYWAVQARFRQGRFKTAEIVAESGETGFFATERDLLSREIHGVWCEGLPYYATMQRKFLLKNRIDRVILTACASSPEKGRQFVYDLYLNGENVAVGPSRLGRAPDGSPLLYYGMYDITGYLRSGYNTLTAVLSALEGKQFYCDIRAFGADGEAKTLTRTTDGSWHGVNGDLICRPGDNIGTHYYKAFGWNVDTGKAPAAAEVIDRGLMFGEAAPAVHSVLPVRRFRATAGVTKVTARGNGLLVDIGREIVGGVHVKLRSAGGEVEARFGEEIGPDGGVKFRMNTGNVYREHWKLTPGACVIDTPDMFTWRYLELLPAAEAVDADGAGGGVSAEGGGTAADNKLALYLDEVWGLELRADLGEPEGRFDSDSELLNRLWDLCGHTVRVTTQDIYVDSQSRERGAYEGDMLINQLAAYCFYREYSCARFSAEYVFAHRTWPAEYILLTPGIALADYMRTGDVSMLRRFYPVLRDNTFASLTSESGLVESGNQAAQGVNAVLVDWPPSERDGFDMNVRFNTVLNVLSVKAYRWLYEIARILGFDGDSLRFWDMADRLSEAVNSLLWDEAQGALCDGLYADGSRSSHCSQHASAFALYADVLPPERAQRAAAFVSREKRVRMSVYGTFFLLGGLYGSGKGDAAWSLLTASESISGTHSWAHILDGLGCTITPEAWDPSAKPNMTFSHPWGCAPACVIVEGIFGLAPLSPGFRDFSFAPQFNGLGRASLSLPTASGVISVSYDGSKRRVSLTVPFGARASVVIAGRSQGSFGPGEHSFRC